MSRTIVLAVSALSVSTPLQAAPIALEPSSKWNLSYDKEACRLVRIFGEGENQVATQFVRYVPGPGFDMYVSGKSLDPQGKQFEYRFAPGDEPGEASNLLYGQNDEGMTTWQFSTGLVPHAEYKALEMEKPEDRKAAILRESERAPTITSFEISKGVSQPVALQTGPLSKPLEAMGACMDDLMRSWGFDPQVQRNLISSPEPKSGPGRWVTPRDYPAGALRKNLSGSVRVRLDIDEAGEVTDCTIQQAFSDPAFRLSVCNLIKKRGRFRPAINAGGDPVKSFWGTSFVFITSGS
ncbi:energy transducer TonB [Pontixanthobacter luteolus]|uniref:energy transducer TonB n=1 Tax=Pontixanthobacter luteolus TaxID=295089 RepID=UPI002302B071|nr:energy transducer TonB [Pontixanthobacter luteolus]